MQEHDLISWRKNEIPNDGDSRDPFQRDVHRIIYSDAFRRLRHKTQQQCQPGNAFQRKGSGTVECYKMEL
jgi:dGTP triphosphohydrolase